jgi:hypothetical protein
MRNIFGVRAGQKCQIVVFFALLSHEKHPDF